MSRHLLLTSNGVAGACNAALLLIKHPDAAIRITSPRHVCAALTELGDRENAGATLHLCGIGCTATKEDLKSYLAAATQHLEVQWYVGMEYPELLSLVKGIRTDAKLIVSPRLPTIALMREKLGIFPSAQTLLLNELTKEAVGELPPANEQHRKLRDMVLAANRRFFFFGQDDLNEAAIRQLAGLQPVSPALEQATTRYRESEDATYPLGSSKAMKELRRLVGRIGPIDEPVLIQGPTGSGKEVVARALHVTSERKGAFVAVNCAVLGGNPAMVEDRLFGHIKGAFTGADQSANGAFDEADGGTLFLDEVAELPAEVQTQMLRVLEERTVRPLGTMKSHRVDTRVIAATHKSLRQMVDEGKFREDLYYRLDVLPVLVPPLSERPEDLRSIAAAEVEQLKLKGFTIKISEADRKAMAAYSWPGNVRELRNTLRRAAYLEKGIAETLGASSMPQSRSPAGGAEDVHQLIEQLSVATDVNAAYVRFAYQRLGENLKQTAQRLGVAPNTVRKHLA